VLAIAVGAVAIASAISLTLFFAIQGPFGTINDVLNGVLAILAGALAWTMSGSVALVYVAILGALIAVVGSALVITGATGFFLAGLVSSVGFALIGAWLLWYSWSLNTTSALRWLGVTAGALMVLGIVVLPGIAMRLDDMNKAPAWIWVGFVSWLGIYAALPAWSIWFGLTRQAAQP
jgi:hypothetical protein